MLKPRLIAAASLALLVVACGSDPVSYSEPRYASPSVYAGNASHSDYGRIVAIDVVRGAVVGNEAEKRRNADDESYQVTVQLHDGGETTFTQQSLDGLRVGDRVRVDGSQLYRD